MVRTKRLLKFHRRFLWFTVICLLVGAGFLGRLFLSSLRVSEDLEFALESIREQGDPVQIEDLLEHCEYGDPMTVGWLRGLADLDSEQEVGELTRDEKLGYRSAWEKWTVLTGSDERAPDWEELLVDGSQESLSYWWDQWPIGSYLRELPPRSSIEEIELAAFASLACANEAVFEYSLKVTNFGNIDKLGELEEMLSRGNEDLHIEMSYSQSRMGYFSAVEALSYGAVLAALEGRHEESSHYLALAFKAAGLFDSPMDYVENLVSTAGMGVALYALNICLTYLPESADLSTIESKIREWRPKANFTLSLRRGRALGNSVFRYIRLVGSSGDNSYEFNMGERLAPFLYLRILDSDQLRYLDLMELMIEESEKPLFDQAKSLEAHVDDQLDSNRSLVTMAILPGQSGLRRAALACEVKRHFALSVFEARRNGVEAGLATLDQFVDPFSGLAYRTRVEEDGRLVMWSIGENGIDDEAQWDERKGYSMDVVWRYRPSAR